MKKSTIYKLKASLGFTLVELIVSIALFTVLALGVIVLVSSLLRGSSQQSGLLSGSDQARKLSFRIMSELRNATTSNTGSYALEQAGDQQIIFYSNIDGGTDIERVRYYVSSGKLYRGIVKPTGNPLTYNVGNETTAVVQNDVANGAGAIFLYYPDTYNGTGNALSQTVNVTQVKFVKMNLQIYQKAGVTNTNYYTVTASGTVRNLKTNLGN